MRPGPAGGRKFDRRSSLQRIATDSRNRVLWSEMAKPRSRKHSRIRGVSPEGSCAIRLEGRCSIHLSYGRILTLTASVTRVYDHPAIHPGAQAGGLPSGFCTTTAPCFADFCSNGCMTSGKTTLPLAGISQPAPEWRCRWLNRGNHCTYPHTGRGSNSNWSQTCTHAGVLVGRIQPLHRRFEHCLACRIEFLRHSPPDHRTLGGGIRIEVARRRPLLNSARPCGSVLADCNDLRGEHEA